MYIPEPFKETDPQTLHSFMAQYNFATMISTASGAPYASHIPLLHIPTPNGLGLLQGHMAKANPQWQHLAPNTETLFIFQGPHAYISPSWYKSTFNVPTWNYTAVHAYGLPRLIHDSPELNTLLDDLVLRHEAHRQPTWSIPWEDPRYAAMLDHIVGFEITLTRTEGKFKLSQNKPPNDRQDVITALENTPNPASQSLAEYMRTQQ